MHTIPAAMILRKPSWLKTKKETPDVEVPKIKLSLEKCYESDVRKELVRMGTIDDVPRREQTYTLEGIKRTEETLPSRFCSPWYIGKPTEDANNDLYNKTDKHLDGGHSNSILGLVLTAFKLYTKPMFLLICLCRAVHFIAFIPTMTTVVDFVMDKGFLEQDGKYAIAALSLGDLVGRLCFGWVTDKVI
ncbi:monocarboxylate transporter 5 [Trichonephila clavata]|uniref:Monocarboxylate transporter 5 n=1 Tax=Trichonephila clavata TaxID=2740835 RepID=A0A8X6GDA2_TRICU|nr:monocarboxylate transporter 5 [Trichonephila clavata]